MRCTFPRKEVRIKRGMVQGTRAGEIGTGNFWAVMWVAFREATVMCCGVVVARPQG
jgi:hypothetical protein